MLGATLRRTTDMESPHRQLRARLANRLGGNDAHRFADVDVRATCQITAVTCPAGTALALASQNRTDKHRVDTRLIDLIDLGLVDKLARLDQLVTGLGVENIGRCGTSQNTFRQGIDKLTALDDGPHRKAILGTAIHFDDDAILRHIDETTCQIARIRGLQSRIRQALTRAMRRVEIFENGQAVLEVRNDGRLNDLAGRLGHQAAHTSQLFDLGRGTTRT